MSLETEFEKAKHKIIELEGEIRELQNIIKWMENSNFWKIRNSVIRLVSLFLGNPYNPGVTFKQGLLGKLFRKRNNEISNKNYQAWLKVNTPGSEDLERLKGELKILNHKPLVSILMPVFNTPATLLEESIKSVKSQIYNNWELCIADDCSSSNQTLNILKKYESDPQINIVYRSKNGHISESSNTALEMAKGEFTVLFDHDDLITADCLFEIVKCINNTPDVDIIYSDEDKVDLNGNFIEPHFKPGWCPDNLLSRNYIGHVVVVRTKLLNDVGGFRKGFEGSQDYDLLLRLSEKTDKIVHLPKILYHWRIHKDSVASNPDAKPYAYIAAQNALKQALQRRNEEGIVSIIYPGFYNIIFKCFNKPKVSIVIPCKDKTKLTKACIESIFSKTTYDNFEVVIIDNGSTNQSFHTLMNDFRNKFPDRFKVYEFPGEFNFSKIINYGVEKSNGEYVILLNNDTEIITVDWIEKMLGQCQRKGVGVVGVKLLFPNNQIQHAGVVLGLGGVAKHAFVGSDRNSVENFCYPIVMSNYSALTAACFMVSKFNFNQVNGFEEKLAVEYNDVDFCLKIRELGLNNVYAPYVELFHYESVSRGNPLKDESAIKRHIAETSYMKMRWKAYIENDPCFSTNLIKYFMAN